jgi:hypothetical protein
MDKVRKPNISVTYGVILNSNLQHGKYQKLLICSAKLNFKLDQQAVLCT